MKKLRNLFLILVFIVAVAIFLPNNVFATTEADTATIIKKLAPDGANVTFNMKEPTTMEESDMNVNGYVNNVLCGEDYSVYGYYDMESKKCEIEFYSSDYSGEYDTWDNEQGKVVHVDGKGWKANYSLNAKFVAPATNSTINSYISKLKNFSMFDEESSKQYYVIEDLSLINYYLTSTKSELWNSGAPGRALKYSSLNEITKGSNITYYLDIRAGIQDETLMFESAFGPMSIFYNGYSYGTKEQGLYLRRVIYIPESTADTTDAFVTAAQKRINEYLGNTSVTVTYGGKLSSLPEDSEDTENPVEGNDGNYYNVKIAGRTYKFYIVKGTEEKLVEPTYIGTDIASKIEISSEDSYIPLDTSVSVKHVNDSTIKDKIGTENYKSYDITLYSDAKGAQIKELANGKFEVRIPVPSELEGKTLVALYITTAGEKEEHEVTIKDGYAVFETNHFSVYTLAEKVAEVPAEEKTEEETEEKAEEAKTEEPKEESKEETKEETKKGEKDETPKTGNVNPIVYIIATIVVSGCGIIVLNRKK